MERRGHAQGLFNKFSILCNVLPYFGYLDQSYKMMAQLNKNSKDRWADYEEEFCLNLLADRRRDLVFCFSYSDRINNKCVKDVLKFLKTYPIVYKVFNMPVLNIISDDDLNSFISFAKELNNKFLRFT